jgi:NADH dehydrogenase
VAMEDQHHVVIVGGGFAGLNAARSLRRAPVRVTLIDRRNHHLFQPLLYQVATGGLSPADISTPIRALLQGQKNARVILGDVEEVDVGGKTVTLADGEQIGYDTLVLAPGARHSYFGRDEWANDAPALKTVEDAIEIRRRILIAFEAAERVADPEERRKWLTFIIVGGGPTGVELAGAIGELAQRTFKDNFRSFDPGDTRIFLFEGGDRVLPSYAENLSGKVVSSLERLGVTVRTGTLVREVTPDWVDIDTDGDRLRIPTRTVLWAAGVQASNLGRMVAEASGAPMDRTGRILVEPDLTVSSHPEIFVAGDLASYSHQTGEPLRGTADVAIAEGSYVGNAIRRRLAGEEFSPFRFRDLGTLAVIGRSAAVADFGFVRFSGRPAWWAWLFIHLLKLVDFQNRLTVMVQWSWSYLTRNRSARLITGELRLPFDERHPDDHSSSQDDLPVTSDRAGPLAR